MRMSRTGQSAPRSPDLLPRCAGWRSPPGPGAAGRIEPRDRHRHLGQRHSVSVKQDSGADVTVNVPETANMVRTEPGSKTLTGATKIALTDIAAGDRVLILVAGDPPAARLVVVNKQSDIAAKQQQEQADWARRGVGGLVKAVDAAAGTVTITATNRTITIHTTPRRSSAATPPTPSSSPKRSPPPGRHSARRSDYGARRPRRRRRQGRRDRLRLVP